MTQVAIETYEISDSSRITNVVFTVNDGRRDLRKIGPPGPNFFLIFQSKKNYFKKLFLYLGYKQKDKTMTTTNYINSNGLGLKVTQLPSGTFDLYFSNGFTSTCYTEEELQDLIQRKGFQQTK